MITHELPDRTYRVIEAGDGTRLHAARLVPSEYPDASVALLHGLGEHSGRYAHVIRDLNSSNLAVYCLDFRGFGQSPGKRGHAEGVAQLVDDVATFLSWINADEGAADQPLFLIGHSFGGLVAIHFLLESGKVDVDGAVLSSPALGLRQRPVPGKVLGARILSWFAPALTLHNEVNPDEICSDPDVVDAYVNDPLCHDRISCQLAASAMQAQQVAVERAAEIQIPMLVMAGRMDRIIDWRRVREFSDRLGSRDKLFHCFDGFAHEIFNEPARDRAIDKMTDWITDRA